MTAKTSSIPRHCMVVHAHYPIGETRVEREALALQDHGFAVDVICLGMKEELSSELVDGVQVYRLPVTRHSRSTLVQQLKEYLTFFLLASLKLVALHLEKRYAVIQVHNLPDWLVFVCLIPHWMGARVILDLHDLTPEFFAARFQLGMDSLIIKCIIWQEQLSCRFADHVFTVTHPWRETLIRRGLTPAKVSVLMNIADPRVFHQANAHRAIPARQGQFQLFYHGNLTYRYGIDLAIRAVGILKDQIPGLHFHIHGWGDDRSALVELVRESGLEKWVEFSTHSLATSELPDLIRQADICLVPYRDDIFTDDILPTKLMEYAALGMPVVAARTTAIARYFDETMVQFCPPGDLQGLADTLLHLFMDPTRLAQLSQGIAAFNCHHPWPAISAEYVRLVKQLGQARKGMVDPLFPVYDPSEMKE